MMRVKKKPASNDNVIKKPAINRASMKKPALGEVPRPAHTMSLAKCSECDAVGRSLLPRQWTHEVYTYTCCKCHTGGISSDEDPMWKGMKSANSLINVKEQTRHSNESGHSSQQI
jgi:hypothetical protein